MLPIKPGHQLLIIRSAGGVASAAAGWTNVAAAGDIPDVRAVVVGATDTELVPSPAASSQNVLGHLSVFCESGTVTVTIKLFNGTIQVPVAEAVLKTRQSLVLKGGDLVKVDATGTPLTKADSPSLSPSTLQLSIEHARANVASTIAGADVSFWRGTGYPAQGAVPAAAAVCNNTTVGAIPLAARTAAQVRRLVQLTVRAQTASQNFHVEDRLAHMGGLSGTVTTAQTVNIDLQTLAGTNNIAARKGASNFAEVEWFLEWYTATGATVATPVVAVTYDDGSTGNANIWNLGTTALPATVAASRRYKVMPAVAGRHIRGVVSITCPTTGTAGSYGVTAVKKLARVTSDALAYRETKVVFDKNCAPVIQDEACLTFSGTMTATASGLLTGNITQDVSES